MRLGRIIGHRWDDEEVRAAWFVYGILIFLIVSYYTFVELKYAIWSTTATATITEAREESVRRRRSLSGTKKVLRVSYEFTESDGIHRRESDDISIHWDGPRSGGVTVQYFAGVDHSGRIKGTGNVELVVVFAASMVGLGFCGCKVWRIASDAVHGRSRRCL